MTSNNDNVIALGKISGVYGIKGWLKVYSHTEPAENILSYQPWLVGSGSQTESIKIADGKKQGKSIIIKLDGVDDRNEAQLWIGKEIAIYQSQLPELESGYYWNQLIGLTVRNNDDVILGKVTEVFATGANDVLVVEGTSKHLIPFVEGPVIANVDLDAAEITALWGEDWSAD